MGSQQLILAMLGCLIALALSFDLVTAINRNETGRAFSLFSIVQFPNSGCTAQSSSTTYGTCYTATECIDKGGIRISPVLSPPHLQAPVRSKCQSVRRTSANLGWISRPCQDSPQLLEFVLINSQQKDKPELIPLLSAELIRDTTCILSLEQLQRIQ